MKLARSILIAATLVLPCTGSNAASVDLYTMNCKAFLDADKDVVLMILAWLDGWYKGDSDEAKFDPDVFTENTRKIAAHCIKNPNDSIVTAADAVLGGK